MFSFSDVEWQYILTGAQVQTNVAAMKEKTETNEKEVKKKKKREMDTGVMKERGGLRKEV